MCLCNLPKIRRRKKSEWNFVYCSVDAIYMVACRQASFDIRNPYVFIVIPFIDGRQFTAGTHARRWYRKTILCVQIV